MGPWLQDSLVVDELICKDGSKGRLWRWVCRQSEGVKGSDPLLPVSKPPSLADLLSWALFSLTGLCFSPTKEFPPRMEPTAGALRSLSAMGQRLL